VRNAQVVDMIQRETQQDCWGIEWILREREDWGGLQGFRIGQTEEKLPCIETGN
jgi:hypothetical protein